MKLQVQSFDFNTETRIGETFYIDVKDQSDALLALKAMIALRGTLAPNCLLYFDYGKMVDDVFIPWQSEYGKICHTFLDILEWNDLEEYHASLAPTA